MTEAVVVLDVTSLATRADYQVLLQTAAGMSQTLGLVLGPTRTGPQLDGSLERQLAPFVHSTVSGTEWPGTSASEPYTCLRYSVAGPVLDALATATDSILNLDGANGMPFDLHFLRVDGSPVLASVTGDARVWFELRTHELAALPGLIFERLGLRPPPGPMLTHSNAVWGGRADCIVESQISTEMAMFEQLPCRELGSGRFEVCCIPSTCLISRSVTEWTR
jgi:hypothetical protein